MKKIISCLLLFLIINFPLEIFAETEKRPAGEKKMFTITGYYSPLKNQSFFLTGSYESEIRLNGNGTHGADGTPVYPGIIAAAPSYAFGTTFCIPGFGCGTKHDTGQAIVNKGERNIAIHDRLDLWMGYGDEGLRRALAWGLQHLECEVYGPEIDIAETVNFTVPLAYAQILDLPPRIRFEKNLSFGNKGDEVEKLQNALKFLGYYKQEISRNFDQNTRVAIYNFQIKNFILSSWNEAGAGNFGPRTREILEEKLYNETLQKKIKEKWDSFEFNENLSKGSRDVSVFRLQELLIKNEYMDTHATGFFGKITAGALSAFQIGKEIINSEETEGAGNVGPRTREKLNKIIEQENEAISREILAAENYQAQQQKFSQIINQHNKLFQESDFGDEGIEVENLQKALQHLGFFSGHATGFFGYKTKTAVRKFQLANGIISSKNATGSGRCGPSTVKKLEDLHITNNFDI